MGADLTLPQGPHVHCGDQRQHDLHPNSPIEPGGPGSYSYCDGVPPLEPFLELVVRVPLVGDMSMEPTTHEEALVLILEEGLTTFVFDELLSPRTRVALRLRWGGEDRVYPLVPDGDYALKVQDAAGG